MIANLRLAMALAAFVVVTPFFAAWQLAALASGGRLDDGTAPRLWHRFILKLLGMRVRRHGDFSHRRPLMLAANHVSWTDIMVLGSLADIHFIAKAEVRGWPVIGGLARLQRTVFVDRTARRRAAEQAGEIASRMANGDPMVLFAEGTTSDGSGVRPFNATLFSAAALARGPGEDVAVWVQPVAIAYTHLHGMAVGRHQRHHLAWIGDMTLLPHMFALLRDGAVDVEVHFGEALPFRGGDDRKAIARQARNRVQHMLSQALHGPPASAQKSVNREQNAVESRP